MKSKKVLMVFVVLCSLLLLLWTSTLLAGGAQVSETKPAVSPPNILFIIVDTLRPDHVSAYGYGRPTTPNLDTRLAAEGALFHANTSSPWTCPSNAAVMTGRSPSVVGATWETIGETVPAAEKTLAEYLHDAGYYTAGFTSRPYCVRGDLGFAQGFDHYDDGVLTGIPSSSGPILAETLNGYIFDWLDTTWTPTLSGTQPLFLFAYYFDPHTWYDPPPPYDLLYDNTYTGTLTAAVFGHGETAKDGTLTLTPRDLEHLLALYDGEITYWDDQLGLLLDRLQTDDLLDNTMIVLTADHGEMFGEHDEWSHAGSLYEEVVRVPLLLRYSGVISAGLHITTPVQSMDLMPTILDYVGITPTSSMQAISLRPSLSGTPLTGTRPIYSEVDVVHDPASSLYWASPPSDLRTIRAGDWKYIWHLGQAANNELYALQPASPFEANNVINQETAAAAQLRHQLDAWFFPYHQYLPVELR